MIFLIIEILVAIVLILILSTVILDERKKAHTRYEASKS